MSAVRPETGSETCDEVMQLATEPLTSESVTSIQRKWTKTKRATTVPIFTLKTNAVREFLQEPDSATSIFCNFFDDHVMDHIVLLTNLYAVQNEKRFDLVQSSNL